jgi:hypothetical protein
METYWSLVSPIQQTNFVALVATSFSSEGFNTHKLFVVTLSFNL